MRRRPVQDVRIWKIHHRPEKPKPYGVRWVVDGDPKEKWHHTRTEADRYRSRLMVARHDGEWFDRRSGEPESWRPAAADQPVYAWARQWLASEWPDWAPRSRTSALEALTRFLPLVVDAKAPEPPADLRRHLRASLPPGADVDEAGELEKWLAKWGLTMGELDRELLAESERRLGIGDTGQRLAASTSKRYRKVARSCVRRGAELKGLPDPWPSTPPGRARRKARRQTTTVDVRQLPDPVTMVAILAAIPSHQPGSRKYLVMTAVTYYAGLRPSEVKFLRPRALDLPEHGWGVIRVTETDDGEDEPADPKTGRRAAPAHPALVSILRRWIDERRLGSNELLFRTRTGRKPTDSNWNRALKRACRVAEHRALSPYDGRHACATTWIRAGVPLGDAARWLGHSVETLVSTYVGALQGDDVIAMQRIEAGFAEIDPIASGVVTVLGGCWLLPRGGPANTGQQRTT